MILGRGRDGLRDGGTSGLAMKDDDNKAAERGETPSLPLTRQSPWGAPAASPSLAPDLIQNLG